MKIARLILICLLSCLGSGCRLAQNALQTTVIEPIQYPRNAYDTLSHHRFGGLAAEALEVARANTRAEMDDYECNPFSPDFELGFLDGYVDYLEAGGDGTPPVVPPRRYWKSKYQTVAGNQAIQDWFRGYEYGSGAALASNYRRLVTVPISDTLTIDSRPYPYGRVLPGVVTDGTVPSDESGGNRDDDVRFAQLPTANRGAADDVILDPQVPNAVDAEADSE